MEFVSRFLVILLAAATYMSGIGGGSAIVIPPLAFAALIAFLGTKRRDIGFKRDESEGYGNLSLGKLFGMIISAILLLSAVIFDPLLNNVF
ncbi:hypothetical protein AKA01nite_08950 [Alkalibacterium kapii]|uniref:Uncharacterized protein n=1 Tax=Alkalibacterium kapii TaxID=426704 RepID=A0A511AVA3_9LACT|nr:hypothetical protein AKA01nite_08950 [Alkalibacterium kapii]